MTIPTAVSDSVRRDLRPLVPAAVLLALWLVWIGASGGYNATVWYPSALGVLSLWVVVVAWGGRMLPDSRPARVALLSFLALVAFNYLSVLWAGSAGSALDASNELALYLLVAWIFAVLPWTPRALALLLGAWSLGVGVFCAVALVRATSASSLTDFFVDGRFATPMLYSNATAAVAVMGMWPALIFSSRRELPFWLRGPLLGVAAFLVGFSTLPQSRAALLGLALTAPVALVASSDRWRLLARMAVVAGALAVCLPRTISVNQAVDAGRNVTPELRHAAVAMLLVALASVVIGLVLALLENSFGGEAPRPARGWSRLPGWSTSRYVLGGATVIVIVVLAVVAEPKVAHVVHTVVQKGNTDASTGSNRLLSTSPEERFDYARVALHLFSGSPVLGVGAGNFGRRYDALREFVKHSLYTHNLPLRVLSETGVVGLALFLVLVGALVIGTANVARRRVDLGRACATIALCVSGYFLVHSCLDWVDEFPALAAPAIGLPMAVMALSGPDRAASGAGVPGAVRVPLGTVARRRVLGALGIFLAMFLLIALGSSYLSLRYVNRAFAIYRTAPRQADHDLSIARSLSPLSANPITSEGTIALYQGDTTRSRRAFEQSLANEDDWYPRIELALIDSSEGRFGPALGQVDAAIRLDADDPLMTEARQQIVAHKRINPFSFNRRLLQEANVTSSVQQPIR